LTDNCNCLGLIYTRDIYYFSTCSCCTSCQRSSFFEWRINNYEWRIFFIFNS